jgi:hypothetical protein
MSTEAGTIEGPGRPVGFRLWAAAVSVLAAAALIMSAVALTVAGRGDRSVTNVEGSETSEAASVGIPLWDAGKLEAMKGRALAATVAAEGIGIPLWDVGKLEAMEGRVLAATVATDGIGIPPWDAAKLEAMKGRMLAG